jgi:hypothetical protein
LVLSLPYEKSKKSIKKSRKKKKSKTLYLKGNISSFDFFDFCYPFGHAFYQIDAHFFWNLGPLILNSLP